MTNEELTAFVKAYGRNVANLPESRVFDFINRYHNNDDLTYTCDEATIVDALGIWHEAIRFALTQGANNAKI
jgi:hypothetical protein